MLQAMIIGNLGANASVKESNGRKFVSMNVAHTDRITSNGQTVESTQWVSVSLNHYSGRLLPYLVKGAKVFVQGKLFTRIWKDRENNSNVGINILADTIELCGGRSDVAQTATKSPGSPATAPAAASPAAANESDLPF